MLAAHQAYSIASQWGSLIKAGDPGSCFYGFHFNDGRPASEEHRAACLAYLDNDLIPYASKQVRKLFRFRHGKRFHEYGNALDDLNELRVLRDFMIASPIREIEH